jgi:regulator of ribonuclease activity A
VRALAAFPRKSERGLHSGQAGLPVLFAVVVFREGEWLSADRDGVVVLPEAPAAG